MTRNEELETLINELWESDEASALTNQAARMLVILRDEVYRLRKKSVEDGWAHNPDRSGGQFTQDEINRGDEQFGKWYLGR
jgi:hypothetical protein